MPKKKSPAKAAKAVPPDYSKFTRADWDAYYPALDVAQVQDKFNDPWEVTAIAAAACGYDPTHPLAYTGGGPHIRLASKAIMAVKMGELKGRIVEDCDYSTVYKGNGQQEPSTKRLFSYTMVYPRDFLQWYETWRHSRDGYDLPEALRRYVSARSAAKSTKSDDPPKWLPKAYKREEFIEEYLDIAGGKCKKSSANSAVSNAIRVGKLIAWGGGKFIERESGNRFLDNLRNKYEEFDYR